MKSSRTFFAILAALFVLALAPARATDSHDYAADEYAIIRDGLAPDKTVSLASHGEGEGGSGDFHVWLMAEPGHRKIAALDDIGSSNNLDTGPDSYHAQWSADSRRVAVSFRSNRHVVQLNLYTVENRRARLIWGASLFRDVTGRDVDPQEDMRRSVPELVWKGSNRFVLSERRMFLTSDDRFARSLGRFGKVTDKLDNGKLVVEFSADADCVIWPGHRYRIVDLRVGKFGE